MQLGLNDIIKVEGMNIDPVGFLFRYQNKLFRAINNFHKEDILYLFNSGAIGELNEAHLIPFTRIADIEVEGYDLILEHQEIEVVTFSIEWSFEMLKEAAKLIIDVNKILFKYDLETKDAHYHNVIFDYYSPKFIDIGSFQRRKNSQYWECKDEFYSMFLYPMRMWTSGNSQMARKCVSDVSGYLQRYEYTLYRFPFLRVIPAKFITKISFLFKVLRNLSKFDLDTIFIVKKPELKRRTLKVLHKISLAGFLPHNSVDLDSLSQKIERIKRPGLSTKWGEYHSNVDKDEQFKEGGRFDIIIKLLKEYNVGEVIEIGGNQGLLSIELRQFIGRVICSDYDEVAVDNMFLNVKASKSEITPVLLDLMHPVYLSLNYGPNLRPQLRFKSQAVLALALSHHLLLGQKIPIDVMFRSLIEYTKEYLFIEFTPGGIDKSPNPDWYTLDWFRENFKKYFQLIVEQPSVEDSSRILFFGKIKV